MSDKRDVLAQYLTALRAAIDAIEATQLGVIRQAAERFAATILKERLVHVFGTGHSRMAVEEMFPRYGSFPGFHPIVELSMTYHNPVVGANGQRQAMYLENIQGFGAVLWRNFATSPDDALLAISTSGCNAVTVDVALEAESRGIFVVALTSLEHAGVSTSRHESGRKLHEVADLPQLGAHSGQAAGVLVHGLLLETVDGGVAAIDDELGDAVDLTPRERLQAAGDAADQAQ